MNSNRRHEQPVGGSQVLAGAPARSESRDARVKLLVEAFGSRDLETLGELADAEFDIDAIDLDGRSCLMHAAESGDSDAVRWMLEAGADADVQATEGRTAIHFAAVNGHIAAVAQLLESGADPEIVDRAGRTAASLARLAGHEETRTLLLENKAPRESLSPSIPAAVLAPQSSECERVVSEPRLVRETTRSATSGSDARDPAPPLGLGSDRRAPRTLVMIETKIAFPAAQNKLRWVIEEQGDRASPTSAAELSRRLRTDAIFVEYSGEDDVLHYVRYRNGHQIEAFRDDPEEYVEEYLDDRPDEWSSDRGVVVEDPAEWLDVRLKVVGASASH